MYHGINDFYDLQLFVIGGFCLAGLLSIGIYNLLKACGL